MLKTRFLKLLITTLDDDRYLIYAQDEQGRERPPFKWKNLVFSRHEESFFGTMLEDVKVGESHGIVLNGWQLVSFFAKESFNHFVNWDWNEEAEICLAAAHSLYEAITEKDWLPDFSNWGQHDGEFRWKLPQRVMDEFDPSFWQQQIGDSDRDVLSYINDLFNQALDAYLTRNAKMKELFGPKLELLKKHDVSGSELARYFDEEAWLTWVGIKEDDAPFTIGLRLDEPPDGEGAWSLDVFLRGKKNPEQVVDIEDVKRIPARWRPYLERVDREITRWLRLIPWLREAVPGEVPVSEERIRALPVSEERIRALPVSEDRARSLPLSERENQTGELSLTDEQAAALSGQHEAVALKSQLSEDEAWLFLTEASETLVMLGIEILLPSWWQAMKHANLRVKASLKGSSSHRPSFVGLQAMLDFNWRFAMNGVELSEDEFSQLVEEKRRLVYIRGRWVKLDPQFIRQIQDLMKRAEKEGLHVRDLLEQELVAQDESEDELENPKAFAKIQIELNRQWKQMVKQLSEVQEIPLAAVPAELQGELRPYQQLGMSWLWFLRQYGFGACLADDMGLGKTVQLISYLLKVKEEEQPSMVPPSMVPPSVVPPSMVPPSVVPDTQEIHDSTPGGQLSVGANATGVVPDAGSRDNRARRSKKGTTAKEADALSEKIPVRAALIICPTSVLGNWQKELERFAPELRVYLHYGSNRLKGETFSEEVQEADVVLTSYGLSHLDSDDFESVLWSTIAIDEAQNIKNAATKQSRAVRRLRGRHHIALTGTPMENRLSELWSIFDFTNHGYLGSLGHFQKKFIIPIEKDDKKDKIQQLQALIRPFLLRRTKKDEEVALNLPDKLEQKEYCPLTAEQASLYEQLIHDTFAQIEQLSGFERKGLILQMLSRLKQLCNHPALYLKEKAAALELLERSNKMEKLVELVDAVLEQGESCLIFTQYLEMGEMIRAVLKKKFAVEVPFLNGSVAKSQRDTMIERFQNGEFPVFLLSLKAGGTGLNLTAANHVIHYDRWWNPAVENQATDRAYRIGQSRFVHVHKLICTGTLEEKIDAMLEKKQFLNDQIIQSENWITELSTEELKDLVFLG
ncbi:DEAD/DEAH box helicase [Bacillus rubiinfantis]|uniref:DEAD/DEAH box helicase n=1 Tax=Bacillus rubiinfantis TaxID=1499680 RepID=UPI0005AB66EE|nr:DEAD/DEAH box helicase [Bacillus rubiinfantis]